MESQEVPSDESGVSHTITVVKMHGVTNLCVFLHFCFELLEQSCGVLFMRILVKWQTFSPLQRPNGQWWGPITGLQVVMLITISAHCLLSKEPRPETDTIVVCVMFNSWHRCVDNISENLSLWLSLSQFFKVFVYIWWHNDVRSFCKIFACNTCAEYHTESCLADLDCTIIVKILTKVRAVAKCVSFSVGCLD